MKTYEVTAAFEAHGGEGQSLCDFLDLVDEHLAQLGTCDVTIIASEAEKTFTVSLLVECADHETEGDVLNDGVSRMRTAFHTNGGATPGMEPPFTSVFTRAVSVRELVPA